MWYFDTTHSSQRACHILYTFCVKGVHSVVMDRWDQEKPLCAVQFVSASSAGSSPSDVNVEEEYQPIRCNACNN